MRYKVIISPAFQKEFYKLPKKIQEIARKKLEVLETKLIGTPLKHDLVGFHSIHFFRNQYRIIYHKKDKVIEVLVLHVGKRTDDFYKKIIAKLNRRKSKLGKGNPSAFANLF